MSVSTIRKDIQRQSGGATYIYAVVNGVVTMIKR